MIVPCFLLVLGGGGGDGGDGGPGEGRLIGVLLVLLLVLVVGVVEERARFRWWAGGLIDCCWRLVTLLWPVAAACFHSALACRRGSRRTRMLILYAYDDLASKKEEEAMKGLILEQF